MLFRVIFLSIFLVGFVSCNSSAPVQTTNMSNIIEDIPIEGVAEDNIELIALKLAPKPKLGQPEHECLAETFLFLIGQPKSAIAAIEYPYNTRLFYLGEEKAEGFVANRLNLILDNSQKIVQVYCG